MSPEPTKCHDQTDDRIIRRELVPVPDCFGLSEFLCAVLVACGLVAVAGILAAAVFTPALQ